MGKEVQKSEVEERMVDSITDRLSCVADIYLPHALAMRVEPLSQQEKKSHLAGLLRRDAAIFLERYGSNLSGSELEAFEVLGADYEVNWHLKHLKASLSPSVHEQKSRDVTVKNRRLAFLDRLVQDGSYFSEDAMRMRSPLLHHEYLGQFQDPTARGAARPGERFSEMLIRQSDEALFEQRLKEERLKAGIPVQSEEDVAEEIEEEESDADQHSEIEELETASDDDDDAINMQLGQQSFGEFSKKELLDHKPGESLVHAEKPQSSAVKPKRTGNVIESSTAEMQNKLQAFTQAMQERFLSEEDSDGGKQVPAGQVLSEVELQENLQEFTRIMQEKFLSGGDSEHVDYFRIDSDSTLDDYWLREISQDAEEKYFEED